MTTNGQESIKCMSLLREGMLINKNGGIRNPSYYSQWGLRDEELLAMVS